MIESRIQKVSVSHLPFASSLLRYFKSRLSCLYIDEPDGLLQACREGMPRLGLVDAFRRIAEAAPLAAGLIYGTQK